MSNNSPSHPSPRLSIAFATYNEDIGLLKESFASIQAQSFQDWELILAVEPGDRNTEFLVDCARQDPRLKLWLSTKKLGRTPAINKALSLATAPLIARLDSDDFCLPTRFEAQVAFLDANPGVDVLGCGLLLVGDQGENLGCRSFPTEHEEIERRFIKSNGLPGPGVILRRTVIDRMGLFDPALDRAEDLEYWLRCLKNKLVFHNLPEPLLGYRTPLAQFGKRDKKHWKSNFNSRLKHSFGIWPIHQAAASVLIGFALYFMPGIIHNLLFDNRFSNRFRGVSN